jgi:agmatinase
VGVARGRAAQRGLSIARRDRNVLACHAHRARMREASPTFAAASTPLADARFVVGGFPHDPAPRGAGSEGPAAIRRASLAFERWNLRTGVEASTLRLHDLGDAPVGDAPPDEAAKRLAQFLEKPVQQGKFPVLLGGARSGSAALVGVLARKHADLKVVALGAPLAWRDAHEGSAHHRFCAVRRMADALGPRSVAAVGVRSAGKAELEHARAAGLVVRTAFDVQRAGVSRVAYEVLRALGPGPIHLSIGLDALDPAYAPATPAPEPYGLVPSDVLAIAQRCADRLVGLDVVDLAPALDGGATASLAARLARDTLDEVALAR